MAERIEWAPADPRRVSWVNNAEIVEASEEDEAEDQVGLAFDTGSSTALLYGTIDQLQKVVDQMQELIKAHEPRLQ